MFHFKDLFKKRTQREICHQLADKANREKFETVIEAIRKVADKGQYRPTHGC